ncbi:RNA polymerase sigma-70 factor (ECF subfamily) [Rubricella aquisinus]|uniref:RNA polymerase sigma-70 factor (ECF subfamily) n=1 Tax=Rubricella aquisinus TaxID=2028108 RepID=A0A840WZB5_9RHOB|nr:RNA polymerase sigma factor [Rubricella aquisinus]MBB5514996.1 RNA polymerase sigma-70 factor (ECF subfamily) [Rubricella aquisinus]
MPRVWRYALVLTRRRDTADDLSQNTALRALDRAAQYTPGTRLDAWVFTIAGSIWRNDLRAAAVRRGQGVVPVEDVDLADGRPDAETNILAREVLSLVTELPDAQRDAVFLVYVEGYSYLEAASILDIPVGTVMSRLAAGRRKINEAVKGKEAEG